MNLLPIWQQVSFGLVFVIFGGLLRQLDLIINPASGKITWRLFGLALIRSLNSGYVGILISLSIKIFYPTINSPELIGLISGGLGLLGAEVAYPYIKSIILKFASGGSYHSSKEKDNKDG